MLTDFHVAHYGQWAMRGAPLITIEATAVVPWVSKLCAKRRDSSSKLESVFGFSLCCVLISCSRLFTFLFHGYLMSLITPDFCEEIGIISRDVLFCSSNDLPCLYPDTTI